eukprot:TRINITY_DN10936_c0_g1_i1.p1 TRINITY_DN10936_c0_g1~~TRINITY_DN10936_c0_g1_i1.p1  ORF type:complete len:546 (+),score=159.94 TRINITY_DN10936_c0_g1_i1:122-1759(+)
MRSESRLLHILLLWQLASGVHSAAQPHIFMVVVDDFGWGDIGYHGARLPTGESLTPGMDALTRSGVELNRHYVHMTCTPTRSSLQSGRLPIHVITQLADPCDKNGAIPRNMTGVASHLQRAGYATHQVGKWDAGMVTPTHTPKGRGYDTSLGYFGHGNWMWTESEWEGSHSGASSFPPRPALVDLWDTDRPARSLNGTVYEELIFRDRMLDILHSHNVSQPLFLQYDSKVAHYPLETPPGYQEMFASIEQVNRRVYFAMVRFLDDLLRNVTDTMKSLGMWENTLMVLTSDNGGYVLAEEGDCNTTTGTSGAGSTDWGHGDACFNGETGASNYPLRGGKYTMFEGGIRANAFASGGFLPEAVRGTVSQEMIHVADWYATFCGLAGVSPVDTVAAASGLPPIDSLDMWPVLSGMNGTSPRETILVEPNLLVHRQWKYIKGGVAAAGNARGGPVYPNATTAEDPVSAHVLKCPSAGCLFDVVSDPYEERNVVSEHPDVVAEMQQLMEEQTATIWSAPHGIDPRCREAAHSRYQGFLGPWEELPGGYGI